MSPRGVFELTFKSFKAADIAGGLIFSVFFISEEMGELIEVFACILDFKGAIDEHALGNSDEPGVSCGVILLSSIKAASLTVFTKF